MWAVRGSPLCAPSVVPSAQRLPASCHSADCLCGPPLGHIHKWANKPLAGSAGILSYNPGWGRSIRVVLRSSSANQPREGLLSGSVEIGLPSSARRHVLKGLRREMEKKMAIWEWTLRANKGGVLDKIVYLFGILWVKHEKWRQTNTLLHKNVKHLKGTFIFKFISVVFY